MDFQNLFERASPILHSELFTVETPALFYEAARTRNIIYEN